MPRMKKWAGQINASNEYMGWSNKCPESKTRAEGDLPIRTNPCSSRNHLEGGCPERKGAATCVTSPFSSPATPLSRAAPPAPQGPMHELRLALVGSFHFAAWQTLGETQATTRQQTRGRYCFVCMVPVPAALTTSATLEDEAVIDERASCWSRRVAASTSLFATKDAKCA